VPAKIQCVDVIVLAEGTGDPIPVAGVIQSAMNENERGLAVLAVIPELEFEAIGIKEVRDGFHSERLPSL
jgi:hypothetical protein